MLPLVTGTQSDLSLRIVIFMVDYCSQYTTLWVSKCIPNSELNGNGNSKAWEWNAMQEGRGDHSEWSNMISRI
jgi:hypothetical protein